MDQKSLRSFADIVKKAVQQAWDTNAPAMEGRLESRISSNLERVIDEKLEEKIGRLPSKELFLAESDKLMAELKTIREETTIIPHQYKRLEKRTDNLESKVFGAIQQPN